jgi:hypothetical protein
VLGMSVLECKMTLLLLNIVAEIRFEIKAQITKNKINTRLGCTASKSGLL